jgi:hypothetical protein
MGGFPNPGSETVTVAGTVTAVGTVTPSDAMANPTDAQDVASFGLVWDGANSLWRRARSAGSLTDGNTTVGIAASGGFGFNGSAWDRIVARGDNADAEAVGGNGRLTAANRNYAFNGATWDRLRIGSPTAEPGNTGVLAVQLHAADGVNINRLYNGSAVGDGATGARSLGVAGVAFNGTTWDRLRTGSPTADPGNTGVLAAQLHVSTGAAITRAIAAAGVGDATTGGTSLSTQVVGFNGTTWDRLRTDQLNTPLIGSLRVGGQGSAGIPIGGVVSVQGVSGGTAIPTTVGTIMAANILDGVQTFTATTAATTIITVPATRTWIGNILVSCAVANAAANAVAAEARGTVSVAGAGATPAAGTLFEVECLAGANAATGTVGDQAANSATIRAVIIAPGGNAVTVQLASTVTGTSGRVSASAIGELQ